MNTVNKKVGENIKRLRKAKNISQADMAKEINKSESSYKKYENGQVGVSIDVLMDIAEVLNVTVAYLLEIEEVDVIKLLKKVYDIDTTQNEKLKHDIETYMEFLRYKYSK